MVSVTLHRFPRRRHWRYSWLVPIVFAALIIWAIVFLAAIAGVKLAGAL